MKKKGKKGWRVMRERESENRDKLLAWNLKNREEMEKRQKILKRKKKKKSAFRTNAYRE